MSVYNDIINQGVYYNKSRDDVMRALSQNNAVNKASLSMLDSIYKEEEDTVTTTDNKGNTTITSGTKSQQRDAEEGLVSANDLRRELQLYSESLDGGFASKWTEKERAGKLLTQHGNLIMKIKKAEQLGALDSGLLEFASQVVGEKPVKEFWRNDTIEQQVAKGSIEELIARTDADILSKQKSLGTAETTQTPETVKQTLNSAVEYANNNPDDPQAQQFLNDWKNHNIDLETGLVVNKSEEQMTPFEKEMAYRESQQAPIPQQEGTVDKIIDLADKTGIASKEIPTTKFVNDLSKAGKDFMATQKEVFNEGGDRSTPDILKEAGSQAKLLNDVLGATVSLAMPDVAEKAIGALIGVGMETAPAKAIVEEWKQLEENNPELAENLKEAGQIGMFASTVYGGLKVKKMGGKGKKPTIVPKSVDDVVKVDKTIAKHAKQLKDISEGTKPLRKHADQIRKATGVDVNNALAESGVMKGTVNANGKITTIGKGGALETYETQYINTMDDIVSAGLAKEGKTVSVDALKQAVKKSVNAKDTLRGTAGKKALSSAYNEIDDLVSQLDDVTEIPLSEVNKLKSSIYKGINYDNPKMAMGDKTTVKAIKTFIEETSDDVAVATVNKELAGRYAVRDYIQRLDGSIVKGGKLGKYFAGVTGSTAGTALALGTGNPWLAVVTAPAGALLGDAIKGITMQRILK